MDAVAQGLNSYRQYEAISGVLYVLYFELRNSISLVPEPGRRATLSQAVIQRLAQEVTFL